MIGPTILQGPHHAAQKSTITGFVDLKLLLRVKVANAIVV
jgi:hypothetical protein